MLTADLETSFIVRPEHRVPFYHWLNKSVPSKPPKKSSGSKQGRADHVIMKVNLTVSQSYLNYHTMIISCFTEIKPSEIFVKCGLLAYP